MTKKASRQISRIRLLNMAIFTQQLARDGYQLGVPAPALMAQVDARRATGTMTNGRDMQRLAARCVEVLVSATFAALLEPGATFTDTITAAIFEKACARFAQADTELPAPHMYS